MSNHLTYPNKAKCNSNEPDERCYKGAKGVAVNALVRPFWMTFTDATATRGTVRIKFLPWFDRIPRTGELVNTREKAQRYFNEVCSPNKKEAAK